MDGNYPWVALIDEDKDDFFFWQYGFDCWADQVSLKYFTSMNAFWREWESTAERPVCIVLADLFPAEEGKDRLQSFLTHECCEQAKVFLLTDLIPEDEYPTYQALGATGCFCSPSTTGELKARILDINQWLQAA